MEYFRKNSSWIFSVFFFFLLIFVSLKYATYKRGQWEKDIRNQTLEVLIGKKSRLEKSLYSRIYYTRGVAAFVSLKPEISNDEFRRLAIEFIQNDSVISTMSLSKNCIIGAIYPIEGHEEAIGLDLLAHKERFEIVKKTIDTRLTFVAGPVELVEGGEAFISYTPIFNTTVQPEGEFWGLTDIVIYKDELLKEAGLELNENNLVFALKGKDGTGDKGEVFWGDQNVFNNSPVSIQIELPYGNWILSAMPVNGWSAYYDQDKVLRSILFISSLIISVLLFLILLGINRIRYREREFKAIFSSMDTLIIEFNKEGEYFKIAPTNLELLAFPADEILGKRIDEIFEPNLAKLFMDAIKKCINTKEVIVIDYPLDIKGKAKWFSARVSYKSGMSVIFNIYDITNVKQAEKELRESESRYKKLNSVKNRFFSIIAHDLRNPIASFKNLTELILDKSNNQTNEEKEILIKSIYDTSSGLSDLLENLLSWSRSQQNSINPNALLQPVKGVCESVIESQKTHALLKSIEIRNEIDGSIKAYFDVELTNIIFRNLISNAIKYSQKNSFIRIYIEKEIVNNQLLIHVEDKGIGMSPFKISKLFDLDNDYISHGTNNELGSGLGLILCKDFVELQGGQLRIQSTVGQGSIFTFSLPL